MRLLSLIGRVNQQQTSGEYNTHVIRPPIPQRHDYEIKPHIITLVKQNIFNGHASKNPMDHVQQFEDLCGTTKANGVPENYLKLAFLKFSLGDKAARWLKLLALGSITAWEQCRDMFINHFYPKSKTIGLMNKISTFVQGGQDSFFETCNCFRRYLKDCPHHGFTPKTLMHIFYQGIQEKYQMALDTINQGNFMINTVRQATILIENLDTSNHNHCPDYDRSKKDVVISVETDEIKELREKVDYLLKSSK